MPDNNLYMILGRVYAAKVLNKGSIGAVQNDFAAACEDQSFLSAARQKLSQLRDLASSMPGGDIRPRDVVGAVQLEFLKDALAGIG